MIQITVSEYNALLRTSERVAVLKRMLARDEYISTKELKAILDIEDVKENENA